MVVFVYLDLESTDLHPYSARIVEIAAVMTDVKGKIIEPSFEQRIKADKLMNPKASEVTGIYDGDLQKCAPRRKVLLQFCQWITKSSCSVVLLAYNGFNFDYPLLVCELERSGLLKTCLKPVTVFVDPFRWAQRCWSKRYMVGSFSLGSVYQKLFNRKLNNAHAALADTVGLLKVCQHITFRLLRKSILSFESNDKKSGFPHLRATACHRGWLSKYLALAESRPITLFFKKKRKQVEPDELLVLGHISPSSTCLPVAPQVHLPGHSENTTPKAKKLRKSDF
jgi:DNA polymerase III alpha subunit (gram-positive type)